MTFSAYVVPDSSGAALPTIDISPDWYKTTIRGGCAAAEFDVQGERNNLWLCADLIGREIRVYDERNQATWWGMVYEVRLNIDGTVFGFSLDGVANRVAVAYTVELADGGTDRETTAWSSNSDSIARFGQKELLHSIGEASDELATAAQAKLLANMAWPRGVVSFDGRDGQSATLICVGWWSTLRWRYYARLEGRIEHEGGVDTPGISQAIGWGSTSSLISFKESTITWGKRVTNATNATPIVVTCASHGFTNGQIVTVSDVEGNTAANGTWKVASSATNTFALTDQTTGASIAGNGAYTAGGVVSLDATMGPFDSLATGQVIAVSGSASNNGSKTLIRDGYANGKKIDVLTTLVTETAGASVTIALTGYQMAQKYVQSHAFDLWRVGVKVAKVGAPGDSLRIDLQTDASGSPSGTTVATCSIAGSALSTSNTWFWLNGLSNPALTSGASYWLVIYRSGSVSDTDYYLVDLDATAYETCKAFDGSSWVAQPNGQYMPFRVWGWEDTMLQVRRILTDSGSLLTGGQDVSITSGVKSNQWRDGDLTALDEIEKLLEIGNSSGQRFVVTVTPDRTVRIVTEAAATETGDILGDKNQIRLVAGGLRARGDLPVGEWLTIDKAPLHLNALYAISPQFVDEAEYSVGRDVMRLTPKRAN